MARKPTRQQAMVEVLDAICPAGLWLTYDDALKIAAVCEAVAALYEQGGALHPNNFRVRREASTLEESLLAATRVPAIQDA